MSHGNERWFLDTEVAVKADGTMTGFRTKALDDAGAYLRYEPLGGVIWSQVAAGMYGWRNIRLEFTQAMTNKAPVSPNRGYSRMQQLWFTERVIDIVAHTLGIDPVEIRRKNFVQPEDMPYETPNGCVYDSGDYPRAMDMALDLVGAASIDDRRAEAASRGKLLGLGIGSTIDSGTNNFGQSQLLTAGGPSGASRTAVLFLFETAFGRWELGYASAAAEILFLLILAVTLTQYWATSRAEPRRG
jgi:2-furoyl-CoA dehydrogenase large subunit